MLNNGQKRKGEGLRQYETVEKNNTHCVTFRRGLEKTANFRQIIVISPLLLHLQSTEVKQKDACNQFKPKQSTSAVVNAHRAATFSRLKLLPEQEPFHKILVIPCESLGALTDLRDAIEQMNNPDMELWTRVTVESRE